MGSEGKIYMSQLIGLVRKQLDTMDSLNQANLSIPELGRMINAVSRVVPSWDALLVHIQRGNGDRPPAASISNEGDRDTPEAVVAVGKPAAMPEQEPNKKPPKMPKPFPKVEHSLSSASEDDDSDTGFKCSECCKIYKWKKNLNRHVRNAHTPH